MESNYKAYEIENSVSRIDEILTTSDAKFEEKNSIPLRSSLTFTNGFYVNCSAMFIDIRDSSNLPNIYQRPSLARIYRSYISEMVAVMNSDTHCSDINIEGDCIWGVFDTPYKNDINSVFSTAAKLASLNKILNCRFKKKKGYDPIKTGIDIAYGRALMLKAGFKGSSINGVVWMGEVVNKASKLCSYGNKSHSGDQIMISSVFYNNLNDHNKNLLSWSSNRNCYHGSVINTSMEEWWKKNCT